MNKAELAKRIHDDLKTLNEMNDRHCQYFQKIDDEYEDEFENGKDYIALRDSVNVSNDIVSAIATHSEISEMADDFEHHQNYLNSMLSNMNEVLVDHEKIDLTK